MYIYYVFTKFIDGIHICKFEICSDIYGIFIDLSFTCVYIYIYIYIIYIYIRI